LSKDFAEKTISSLNGEEVREVLEIIKEKKYEVLRLKPNILGRTFYKGTPIFIKIFRRKKPFSFLLSPLRASSSFRAYRTALYMLQNGIDTPKPILSCEKRKIGFVVEDIYVTEDIGEHLSVREAVLKSEGEFRKEIIKKIARLVRKIHEISIYYRDLNLSNFLIKGDKIYLVDINRARILKNPPSFLKRAIDISRMDLHGLERVFLTEYVNGLENAWILKCLTLFFIKIRKVRRIRRFFVRLFDRVMKGFKFMSLFSLLL